MSVLQGVRLSLYTTHVGHIRRQATYMELNFSVSVDFILQQTLFFCNIIMYYFSLFIIYMRYARVRFIRNILYVGLVNRSERSTEGHRHVK